MSSRPWPYPSKGSIQRPELDLRKEFDTLIYGDSENIPHGIPVIIRHMRKNADGSFKECTCRDKFSKDGDPDCSYCYGEGVLFDEKWHMAFREYVGADGGLTNRGRYIAAGEIRADFIIFYLRYDSGIEYGDRIVEVKLDEEGEVVVPFVRTVVHNPRTVEELRSDHGRIEYITAYCREDESQRVYA